MPQIEEQRVGDQDRLVMRLTKERDLCRQELFETTRVAAMLAKERQALLTELTAEKTAREALMIQVAAEVDARLTTEAQLKAHKDQQTDTLRIHVPHLLRRWIPSS